ncbi:Gfo/Idh/MocA family protein [Seinonella peptonophila]|uniref:Gfo/Idh/MocA family protein n=1 Tax=Seinonella peptonophila TaxID=112248 RepID=UPI000933F0A9|nr:Gfo/Idh/MocA family oxidoreductase [Seinonella peptonophila]
MTKIRVGVIGCGSIAKHRHIVEYALQPQVELVAFCDTVIERAQEAADQYGGVAYQDYHEMLERESLDAVSVCTPNVVHAPATVAALKAGCHVLCEKPMSVSDEEALSMIQIAEEQKKKLMIGHNQRLMPPHIKAKEILASGSLGRVFTFRTAFAHGGPESWAADGENSWFFQKDKAFIGAMGDLGVHKIDLLMWLLGEKITEVSAMMDRHEKSGDVEDNAVIVARTESGAIGTIVSSWTHAPGEDNSTILYCERGVMKIGVDPMDQVIVNYRDGSVEKHQVGIIATNDGQVESGVITAFIEAIVNDTEPIVPGEEGLKALQVVLGALQSVEESRTITLSTRKK